MWLFKKGHISGQSHAQKKGPFDYPLETQKKKLLLGATVQVLNFSLDMKILTSQVNDHMYL